ncbi:hypothetical protein [Hydrogenophaga sp. 5NK40-0174]|uniref:hypothetical protein n=1 Tax=Hydrogenophaga sp. 5NK40-0174 TaxID=3127649 RepID=UPI00310B05B0
MKWLDRIPLAGLLIIALWLAVAPITPEPHLIEKWRMLTEGTLVRPIDIFDLFLHTTPLVLLGIRLVRMARNNKG